MFAVRGNRRKEIPSGWFRQRKSPDIAMLFAFFLSVWRFETRPGRWALLLETHITKDCSDYGRQNRFSSNVKAEEGNLARETFFVGP
jgi:hypothetical protein